MPKYNRFSTTAKRTWVVNPDSNLDIIILAAGAGKMKTHGARALLDIKNEKLGQRQIRILRECYPNSNIIYGAGFQAEKVIESLPQNICFIENIEHQETSQVRTLSLCLRASLKPNILLVMGDLIFDNAFISNMISTESMVMFDQKNFKSQEVGLNSFDENIATWFAYNLNKKWAQIAFLTSTELYLIKKFVHNKDNNKACLFESLNYIIDNGGRLNTKENLNGFVLEIDTAKELEKFN